MATHLNTRVTHSAPQPSTTGTGFLGRVGRAIRQMITPQALPQQKAAGRDVFSMGTPSFQAAAKKLISNSNGHGFQSRKVDPTVRSVRDQALVGWLENEFLTGPRRT